MTRMIMENSEMTGNIVVACLSLAAMAGICFVCFACVDQLRGPGSPCSSHNLKELRRESNVHKLVNVQI